MAIHGTYSRVEETQRSQHTSAWLKLSFWGVGASVVGAFLLLVILGEDRCGPPLAFAAAAAVASGTCALGSRSPWKWPLLVVGIVAGLVLGLMSYVFQVKW
jgi:hypothetical protein